MKVMSGIGLRILWEVSCVRKVALGLMMTPFLASLATAGPMVEAQKKLDRAHYDYQRGVRLLPPSATDTEKKALYKKTIHAAEVTKSKTSNQQITSGRDSLAQVINQTISPSSTSLSDSKNPDSSAGKKVKTSPTTPQRERMILDRKGIPRAVDF